VRSRADILFPREKVAVYVDGCFWHGCPRHATIPKTNASYWVPKLTRNRERDAETVTLLESEGWVCLRLWEHEDVIAAADVVESLVRRRREAEPK
jgi:DNA mismatch endonuclease (patch repair protein)